MPPQQVYVSSSGLSADVNSLEHQFHAMGMGHPNQETEGPDEGLDGDVGDDADNDEETSDEDPLKLFVGQVRLIVLSRLSSRGHSVGVLSMSGE
jgi:hypothetical protein